jgi:hypothetical protein
MTFEQWVNSLDGEKAGILGLTGRFYEVDGLKLRHTGLGTFTWGQDTVDLNGKYLGNMTGTGIRWAAFLYLKYLKVARKKGFEPSEFVDLWNDQDDDDEDDS